MAEELDVMPELHVKEELQEFDKLTDHDILRPFGKFVIYDVDVSDSEETDLAPSSDQCCPSARDNGEGQFETDLDVDEVASTALLEVDGQGGCEDGVGLTEGGEKHTCYLEISGKQRHKASLCRIASADFHNPLSTDRLKRVRAQLKYEPKGETILDADGSNDSEHIVINDPLVTVVSVDSLPFLAVVKVCSFKHDMSKICSVPFTLLNDPSLSAIVQIMSIVPREPTNDDSSDWLWDQRLADRTPITVSGSMMLPINPKLVIRETEFVESGDKSTSQELRLDSKTLLAFSQELMERLRTPGRINLPDVRLSSTFPYRYNGALVSNYYPALSS